LSVKRLSLNSLSPYSEKRTSLRVIPSIGGGTVTQEGGYFIYDFTTVGTQPVKFLYGGDFESFLVGGGGGGVRGAWAGCGGGSGGFTVTASLFSRPNSTWNITVGAGGGAGTVILGTGIPGGNSIISDGFSTATAEGGGGGRGYQGGIGGSGGGGGGVYSNAGGVGGSDGSDGGAGNYGSGVGQGTTTREFGQSGATLYSGGGGGGGSSWSGTAAGAGGAGGGGTGNGGSGTNGLGGGGGGGVGVNGGSGGNGGPGGSGRVKLRHLI